MGTLLSILTEELNIINDLKFREIDNILEEIDLMLDDKINLDENETFEYDDFKSNANSLDNRIERANNLLNQELHYNVKSQQRARQVDKWGAAIGIGLAALGAYKLFKWATDSKRKLKSLQGKLAKYKVEFAHTPPSAENAKENLRNKIQKAEQNIEKLTKKYKWPPKSQEKKRN